MQVSEVFGRIATLAIAVGAAPLNKYDGCWQREFGAWSVAVNGHKDERALADGTKVLPFHAMIEFHGWPVGIVTVSEGTWINGQGSEDAFLAAISDEIARVLEMPEVRRG